MDNMDLGKSPASTIVLDVRKKNLNFVIMLINVHGKKDNHSSSDGSYHRIPVQNRLIPMRKSKHYYSTCFDQLPLQK